MSDNKEIILSARGITRDYVTAGGLFGKAETVHALKGIDFDLYRGENPCFGW